MIQIRSCSFFRPILTSFFLVIGLLSGSAGLAANGSADSNSAPSPKEITIGFIPSDEPVKLKAGALELAKHLQESLHIHINVLVSKNYQTLIDDMKAKKVDFAFFTAMSFVFAEKQAGAKVLMKKIWTAPFYYSTVLAEKSKKFSKIEDLKGKRIAFVDQRSTSGYLYPMVMLQKKAIDPAKFFSQIVYSGNHEGAVDLLDQGKVDAIAVFADDEKGIQNAWTKFEPKRAKEIKVLWVSDAIPNDPFAVRIDFYNDYTRFTHDLMFALIDLKSDISGGKNFFERNLGFSSLDLATTGQYQPVREMVKLLNLKLE